MKRTIGEIFRELREHPDCVAAAVFVEEDFVQADIEPELWDKISGEVMEDAMISAGFDSMDAQIAMM